MTIYLILRFRKMGDEKCGMKNFISGKKNNKKCMIWPHLNKLI